MYSLKLKISASWWKCIHNVIISVQYSPLFNCLEEYKVQNVKTICVTTGEVVRVHAMKVCGGGGIVPLILNLCVRLRVVIFMPL
jgi:hypothetical protein